MPYEIPIDMPGLEKVLADVRALKDATGDARREMKALGTDTNRAGEAQLHRDQNRATDPQVAEMRRRVAMRGGRSNRIYDVPRGANQSLAAAEHRLNQMRDSGDKGLIDDAKAAEIKARRAKERQDRLLDGKSKTPQEALMEALMTSRIGPGGQLYPLVGKLKAAGLTDPKQLAQKMGDMGFDESQIAKMAPMVSRLAGAALPTLVAGGAVVAAGYATFRLMEAASASTAQFRKAYYEGGGSPRSTAEALALGGPNAGAKAVALGDALRGGGYGAAWAMKQGIIDRGGNQVDKTSNYVRSVDALRKEKGDKRAIRAARDLGMTEELKYRDMSETVYQRLRESNGMDMTPAEAKKEMQRQVDYEGNKDILGNYWSRALREGLGPAMQHLGGHAKRVFDIKDAKWYEKGFYSAKLIAGLFPGAGQAMDAYDAAHPSKSKDSQAEATDAVKDLTRTLKDQAEMISNGARAGGSLPPGVLMQYADDKFTYQALQLGAFSVG